MDSPVEAARKCFEATRKISVFSRQHPVGGENGMTDSGGGGGAGRFSLSANSRKMKIIPHSIIQLQSLACNRAISG